MNHHAEEDAFTASVLATNCRAFEADRGPAELRFPSLGNRLLPRGLAHQRRYAHQLLRELDGDVDRLLAAAALCRARSYEESRGIERRLNDQRAVDLCEIAAALVTEPAGEDPGQRHEVARFLLQGDAPPPPPRYRLVWTVLLPTPEPFKAACMAPMPRRERLARQLRPRRQVRTCCRYHSGDWYQAARLARNLLREAGRARLRDGEDLHDRAEQLAEAAGVDPWQREAALSLLDPADGIKIAIDAGTGQGFYINGQHRAQLMLEAGVRRTIVVDDE